MLSVTCNVPGLFLLPIYGLVYASIKSEGNYINCINLIIFNRGFAIDVKSFRIESVFGSLLKADFFILKRRVRVLKAL